MAEAAGWTLEHARWEVPLVDLLRARHAQLWLAGHKCKRAGRIAVQAKHERRARFDRLAARYGARH